MIAQPYLVTEAFNENNDNNDNKYKYHKDENKWKLSYVPVNNPKCSPINYDKNNIGSCIEGDQKRFIRPSIQNGIKGCYDNDRNSPNYGKEILVNNEKLKIKKHLGEEVCHTKHWKLNKNYKRENIDKLIKKDKEKNIKGFNQYDKIYHSEVLKEYNEIIKENDDKHRVNLLNMSISDIIEDFSSFFSNFQKEYTYEIHKIVMNDKNINDKNIIKNIKIYISALINYLSESNNSIYFGILLILISIFICLFYIIRC